MANEINLRFSVTKQKIERLDSEVIASGAVQTHIANFEFCDTWAGLYAFCRFEGAGGVKDVRIEDNKCVVPWEVIEAPNFTMAVYGTKSTDVMLTTTKLAVKVYQSVNFISDEPLPSTPELIDKYETIVENAEKVSTELETKAANGDFNGKDGENGRDGVITEVPTGFFAMMIDSADGHLYLFHDNGTTPPPLSIVDGHLIYTFDGGATVDLGAI